MIKDLCINKTRHVGSDFLLFLHDRFISVSFHTATASQNGGDEKQETLDALLKVCTKNNTVIKSTNLAMIGVRVNL